ncbi:hypothetical protein SKAU_G00270340 [Synaphobranchus kaupii]|uniref:Uncharacterized protein n=1 Tax=Synaphobranchus kaupii TaxID=118154 RepID=A0A9Q1F046_SYNKA|nr:hypothetical protein SKAU_G00270340 [Synaphobranchus kaupii]
MERRRWGRCCASRPLVPERPRACPRPPRWELPLQLLLLARSPDRSAGYCSRPFHGPTRPVTNKPHCGCDGCPAQRDSVNPPPPTPPGALRGHVPTTHQGLRYRPSSVPAYCRDLGACNTAKRRKIGTMCPRRAGPATTQGLFSFHSCRNWARKVSSHTDSLLRAQCAGPLAAPSSQGRQMDSLSPHSEDRT